VYLIQTLLVHLSCHSITKTKQGPFSLPDGAPRADGPAVERSPRRRGSARARIRIFPTARRHLPSGVPLRDLPGVVLGRHHGVLALPRGVEQGANWIGYVSVSTDAAAAATGQRIIYVAWRGVTPSER